MSELRRQSALFAPPARVWAEIATLEGINRELGPWLAMTPPPDGRAFSIDDVPVDTPWFRSRILLFGRVPVDHDDLVIVELEPGRRFLERSSTRTQLVWEHERTVDAAPGGGTILTDRVAWTPRAAPLAAAGPVFHAVFAWRHRQLRRRFGRL